MNNKNFGPILELAQEIFWIDKRKRAKPQSGYTVSEVRL
jgi:hypothetical protein